MTVALQAETWGTYSVRDHCRRRPFVADVLLYDRLVIPCPPDEYEAERWESKDWQPERLKGCLQYSESLLFPYHGTKSDDNSSRTNGVLQPNSIRTTPPPFK